MSCLDCNCGCVLHGLYVTHGNTVVPVMRDMTIWRPTLPASRKVRWPLQPLVRFMPVSWAACIFISEVYWFSGQILQILDSFRYRRFFLFGR